MLKLKQELQKNKYKYIFLLTIIVLGIISGIILSNILSYNDKKEISEAVSDYLNNLTKNNISNFINSLKINFIYLIIIFIFSISVIGIILNPFILYFKSFIVGFTLGIFINIYGYVGIIIGILSIFPHALVNIIIYMFLCFYGIKLGIKLFSLLFLKKQFNFSLYMKKYFKVIIASSIILIISSIYEIFLADFIIKVFTFMIK